MLIRSQNKYTLTDMTATSISINMRCEVMAYINGTDDVPEILGKYSTFEKAVKVLDMIQEFHTAVYKKENYRSVFQMPQDDEV